ncbi:MAG: hypothetical protein DHS20C18_30690 [Saprospiraceae bacterium]|nr:MAG: hypothetical protein DHS20C18_30690 [Saprospiraceae bacterium]
MRHTAELIKQELEKLMCLSQGGENGNRVFQPLVKRIEGTPIRAFFVHKIYEEIKAVHKRGLAFPKSRLKETLFTQQLPLLFEGIISVQYLHNQILDQKHGVRSSAKIADNLLRANLLKDYLYEYVAAYIDPSVEKKVTACLRQAFRYVDIGQQMEKQWNTYEMFTHPENIPDTVLAPEVEQFIALEELTPFRAALQKELPREKWEFADLYLQRIYLTCGALFILAVELITDLLGTPPSTSQRLKRFAVCYGLMRQLINDNADVVPSSLGLSTLNKFPEDAFSDIRNRNITLPLILHLSEQPNGPIGQWLASGATSLSPDQEATFVQTLQSSFAIFQSIQFGKLLSQMANYHLAAQHQPALMLADSCNIAEWNRFLIPFIKSNQYKLFRKSPAYRRCKLNIRRIGQDDKKTEKEAVNSLPIYNLIVTS